MNASLATADRRTHLKIILAACLCCAGLVLVAANVAAPAASSVHSMVK